MSLAGSLKQFQSERADAVTRNIQHSRPSAFAPSRTSTPNPAAKPASNAAEKRSHDDAFPPSAFAGKGQELMTQVLSCVEYIQKRPTETLTWDRIKDYLSLPNDLKKNEPSIKKALRNNARAYYLSAAESGNGKESFRYAPLIPVTNEDELRHYLAIQTTAKGISVRELKDGWPDCPAAIDRLESEGHVLVTRNKKDNAAKFIYLDTPSWHVANPSTISTQVGKVDADFVDFWGKIKLPANENDIRTELEKAKLTPTSAVKEAPKMNLKKKERKRTEKKNAKKTNVHMTGILKDYSGKKPGGA